MEATFNYREKLWTESLDMVNNNLIKMYSTQGELKGTLNSIGQRQNDLLKKMSPTWLAMCHPHGFPFIIYMARLVSPDTPLPRNT